MNTETVFRYQGKFYKLNKCFKGKVKSTMISAWSDYVNEWRRTFYGHPPKGVGTRFRDDFRYLKELIGNQTVYLIGTGCLYNREANTCELRMAYPIYSISDEGFINGIGTSGKGAFSSSMFDLELINEFPRRVGGVVTPGDKYVDTDGSCGRDSDIFIALKGEDAKGSPGHRWRMYGTGNIYPNGYDDGYQYFNGKAYQAKRSYDGTMIWYNGERVLFKQLQESTPESTEQ